MSYTAEPPGSRPRCSVCGEHRWAYLGYCLSTECAGPLSDPDYPLSMPEPMREERRLREEEKKKPGSGAKKPKPKKVKMPRKGTRRSTELWYESQGKVAPWLEKQNNDPNA